MADPLSRNGRRQIKRKKKGDLEQVNNIFSFAKTKRDIECIGTKSYMLDLKYNKR
jgi:hypothetical protein